MLKLDELCIKARKISNKKNSKTISSELVFTYLDMYIFSVENHMKKDDKRNIYTNTNCYVETKSHFNPLNEKN